MPERALSLAIGVGGQNARLAARLTGYRIDIASDGQGGGEVEAGVSVSPEVDATLPIGGDTAEQTAESEG